MDAERAAQRKELRALTEALRALEQRVARLEDAGSAAAAAPSPADELEALAPELLGAAARATRYAGRLLIILAGAFVLRAVTESDRVPAFIGASLGLAYGVFWLLPALRCSSTERGYAAAWYGAASALIVYPLLWETSARFDIFSAGTAAALGTACALAAFVIAARCAHALLAGIFAGGLLLVTLALAVPDAAATPYALGCVLGAGLVLLGLRPRAPLRGAIWTCALAADALALLLLEGRLSGGVPGAHVAVGLHMLLFGGYAAMIATELLLSRRPLEPFHVTQTVLVTVAGFGAALWVAEDAGVLRAELAYGATALGLGAYLLAFAVAGRERRGRFLYLTSVALVLILAGSGRALAHPALLWALLSGGCLLAARRFGRATLAGHALAYALAAAVGSQAFVQGAQGWLRADVALPTDPAAWLALGALLLVAALPVRPGAAASQSTAAVYHGLGFVALTLVGGGLLLALAGALPVSEPAWAYAARGIALALLTFGCAFAARRLGWGVARYLVPALLLAGGMRLLLEDVGAGRPLAMAVSFAAFGAALISAPRLARSSPAAP